MRTLQQTIETLPKTPPNGIRDSARGLIETVNNTLMDVTPLKYYTSTQADSRHSHLHNRLADINAQIDDELRTAKKPSTSTHKHVAFDDFGPSSPPTPPDYREQNFSHISIQPRQLVYDSVAPPIFHVAGEVFSPIHISR